MKLSSVKNCGKFKIESVNSDIKLGVRLMELGFIKGEMVEVIKLSPTKSLLLVLIRNYRLILRNNACQLIEVSEATL